jgi:MscS family membrane protein
VAFVATGTILAYGADQLGIPALGLIAGLGVGGFAVALAAQSTIENLFGGVSLFADRPFRIGDTISIGGQAAQVERIGPRSSRLRVRDGTLCTVPNGDLAKAHIINYSMREICFLDQTIPIRGDSAPDRIQTFLLDARAIVAARHLIEKEEGWPRVNVIGTLPGRIQISLQARVLTADYNLFLREQEAILLSLLGLMRELGIELAVPAAVAPEP